MAKARIFIDFWNFQLTLLENVPNDFRVDWRKLPPWLNDQASTLVNGKLDYEGTRVYMSYNPRSPNDRKLRHWANNTLARFPGIDVNMKERKTKGPPKCQECHNAIT